MAEDAEFLFEERQFVGSNKFSLLRRMLFALFCFAAYYLSVEERVDVPEKAADIFFVMGVVLIAASILLLFVMHMSTRVTKDYMIIDGLWTARKVKIDLHSIVSVRKDKYSKYPLSRPKYNLHRKGKIKFYTGGRDAVILTDKEGLEYIVGTQRPDALLTALNKVVES